MEEFDNLKSKYFMNPICNYKISTMRNAYLNGYEYWYMF